MKRIIVGEFENQKKIENILLKEKNNFGVFVDFESAIHLGFENYEFSTIIIYLEEMEVFNKYYTFISENKNKIRLFIKSKKIRPYRGILLNEGYTIIDNLEEVDMRHDQKSKKSKVVNSPRIYMVTGSFEFALRLAYSFSRMEKFKTLFIDTDSVNSFTLKRLNLDIEQDSNYLNESMKNRRSSYNSVCGNLAIAPVIENTELNSKKQLKLLQNLLEDNKSRFDIQIVYCNGKMDELIRQMIALSDQQLLIKWLTYESLMETNNQIKQYQLDKRATVIGLKAMHPVYNHLLIQKLCQLRIIGVVGPKELPRLFGPHRMIDLEKTTSKEKRIFHKVIKELLHRERSDHHG